MRNVKLLFVSLLIVLVGGGIHVSAEEKKDLEYLLDSICNSTQTRADNGWTEVDLEKYNRVISETWVIYSGQKLKFVNGTLTRANDFTGPMIRIEDNSELLLSTNVTLSGENITLQKTNGDYSPIVEIQNGTLYIDGGKIVNTRIGGTNATYAPAVTLSGSEDCAFKLYGGSIQGHVYNKKANNKNSLAFGPEGTVYNGIVYTANDIYLDGGATVRDIDLCESGLIYLETALKHDITIYGYKADQLIMESGSGGATAAAIDYFRCILPYSLNRL